MECIAEKVYKLGKKECNGEALVKTLFGNATRNEQFVTDLTHHLHDNRTMSYKEELWLEAIDRFSLEKCPSKLITNAPNATKVICFSHLLKCLSSLLSQVFSSEISLFWVHTVCFYT